MRGLERIRRRASPAEPAPAPAPAAEQAAAVLPQAPAPDPAALPADVDPGRLASPGFRDRGRFRRRLRYLRRVRELGFRDLGGLVFDLHRFGREGQGLVEAKLAALLAVDRELRALEKALDDAPNYMDLREPGIAACPRCAALHGSDARFCPSCGMRLSGPTSFGEVGDAGRAPEPATPAPAATVPAPAGDATVRMAAVAGEGGGPADTADRPVADADPGEEPGADAASADESGEDDVPAGEAAAAAPGDGQVVAGNPADLGAARDGDAEHAAQDAAGPDAAPGDETVRMDAVEQDEPARRPS